jgi:hypothetical protein
MKLNTYFRTIGSYYKIIEISYFNYKLEYLDGRIFEYPKWVIDGNNDKIEISEEEWLLLKIK